MRRRTGAIMNLWKEVADRISWRDPSPCGCSRSTVISFRENYEMKVGNGHKAGNMSAWHNVVTTTGAEWQGRQSWWILLRERRRATAGLGIKVKLQAVHLAYIQPAHQQSRSAISRVPLHNAVDEIIKGIICGQSRVVQGRTRSAQLRLTSLVQASDGRPSVCPPISFPSTHLTLFFASSSPPSTRLHSIKLTGGGVQSPHS